MDSNPIRTAWPTAGDALLLIDVQRDFLPGGALGVPCGDAVIAPLNRAIARFVAASRPILASRDWHPAGHASFVPQGGPWPVHCVQQTHGAGFADDLHLPADAVIVSKGTGIARDGYSAFEVTGLAERLRGLGIGRLFVGGLATDYCVLQTVLDALAAGFRVRLLTDAMRAVDVRPGDGRRAVERMVAAGAVPAGLPTAA